MNLFYYELLDDVQVFTVFRQRVPGKNVFYYKCPDHRKNYVMSFAFQFDREDDVYEVRMQEGDEILILCANLKLLL